MFRLVTSDSRTAGNAEPVTIDDVVDHYDHVRDLVGIEHVGVGSDVGLKATISPRLRNSSRSWPVPITGIEFTEPMKW
ncbi:MAG: membrane dipeptidase [Terracidiphilus sp.]